VFEQDNHYKSTYEVKGKVFGMCPLCKEGKITENKKAYYCSSFVKGCKFTLWKNALEPYHVLTEDLVSQLLEKETLENFHFKQPQTGEKNSSLTINQRRSIEIRKHKNGRPIMLSSIGKNLLGFDAIIIVLALFNAFYVIRKLKETTTSLRKRLQTTVYLPIERLLSLMDAPKDKELNLHELQSLREKELVYYHLFATLNSLFPLLGILGTIIGLLRMVGMENQLVMANFTLALTSTFWGLVFSIIFKAIDGMIAPNFYQNQENLQLLFERMDDGIRKENV
jgi:biopolymer transport protein ExbB